MIRFLQSGNKAVKYVLGAILMVICLSMVVYLIPGLSSDIDFRQKGTEVASVGGEKISAEEVDRKSTRLNSSHQIISYAVFCLKKKKNKNVLISRHRIL